LKIKLVVVRREKTREGIKYFSLHTDQSDNRKWPSEVNYFPKNSFRRYGKKNIKTKCLLSVYLIRHVIETCQI